MNIGIIGAGVAGMSAAWDLVQRGHQVTIFEAEDKLGGLASGFKDPTWNWSLEKFYHHWFETDDDLLRLATELGVREKVLFPRPKTSYLLDGRLYRSEISPSALLLPISPLGKLQLGLSGVFMKLWPDWRPLEKVTAAEWLLRYAGREVYEKLWQPLLIGKFSDEYDKINMAWLWARVHARSLRLGIFEGGFQAFMEVLGKALRDKGVTFHMRTPIQRIQPQAHGDHRVTLHTAAGELHSFQRVLSTVSPRLMLKLTDGLNTTDYGRTMADLKSMGAVCVVLALKQSLLTDGTYWLNLPATSADKRANRFPFLALVEHTNFIDKAHYGGDHLLYCGDYVSPQHEYFTMSDEDLTAHFVAALPSFNSAFDPSWVRKAWVFRAPYAQPVPYVNHSANILPLQTPLPNIYWASMSQIYPWDRGTNYSIQIGRQAAADMLSVDMPSAQMPPA
jgi:protoporphyrinogen oxidase